MILYPKTRSCIRPLRSLCTIYKGAEGRSIDSRLRKRTVTTYQIEVRAVSERYDRHAHRLAREILQLPTRHLTTLISIPDDAPPFLCRTAQLYRLTGNLTPAQISQLNQQLLTDGVIQQATITTNITPSTKEGHIVDVFFHPG